MGKARMEQAAGRTQSGRPRAGGNLPSPGRRPRPGGGRAPGRRRWISPNSTTASAISCAGCRSRSSRISFARSAPVDVRPAQYSVLVLIAANPGRSQAVIGKALNIERARLARMLHELERRQWIERRRLVRRWPVPFAVHDRGRQGSHGADREFGGAARAADGQVHRATICANCCWNDCRSSAGVS